MGQAIHQCAGEAKDAAEQIRIGNKIEVPRLNTGFPSKDTTQVSVVDGDGNCVTMTHSLGMPSGVITEVQFYLSFNIF